MCAFGYLACIGICFRLHVYVCVHVSLCVLVCACSVAIHLCACLCTMQYMAMWHCDCPCVIPNPARSTAAPAAPSSAVSSFLPEMNSCAGQTGTSRTSLFTQEAWRPAAVYASATGPINFTLSWLSTGQIRGQDIHAHTDSFTGH